MAFTKKIFYGFFLFLWITSSSCFDSKTIQHSKESKKPDSELTLNSAITARSPLYVSTDMGATWSHAGMELPQNAEMSFLEKMGNEMVAATDNVGLFISQNKKTSWKDIGEKLPSKKINALHVSDQEIFVGPYRKGIFQSKNQGVTWENLTFDLPNLQVNAISKIDDQLLVGTDIGIYTLHRTQKKWERKFNAVQVVSMNFFDKKLIAGTNQGTLLSEDQGANWKWIHRQGAAHNTAILDGKIILMNVSGDTFISKDWGKTWEDIIYFPKKAAYVYESTFFNGQYILSNNYGVHRSTINEKTFELIFKNEAYSFFDFLILDGTIYGATRTWNEYRGGR